MTTVTNAAEPRDAEGPVPEGWPPRYVFAIGEHVIGQGVNGKIVERPGPWSVTVIQKPGDYKLTASTKHLSKAP